MSKPDKVTPVFNFAGSPFEVPVVEIVELKKCANSRNLSEATVRHADDSISTPLIVPSDMFHVGDLAFVVDAYYVVDTDLPIFSFLNKRRRAVSKSRRVMIKPEYINGNYSEGVCLPLSFVTCFGASTEYKLGGNLIDELGIRPSDILIYSHPEAYERAVSWGRVDRDLRAEESGRGHTTFRTTMKKSTPPTRWEWQDVIEGALWNAQSEWKPLKTFVAPPKDKIVEYQDFVSETAIFPQDMGVVYTTLALNGEAGELAEKIKKIIRDKKQFTTDDIVMSLTSDEHEGLVKEAGDVIWYITAFLEEIGSSLDEAITVNMEKLKSRRDRGVLTGSGDNR